MVPTMAMMSRTEVELKPCCDAGDEEAVEDRSGVGVGEDGQGDDEEVHDHEDEHEALPAPEAARGGDGHQAHGGQGHRDVGADPEVAEGQADPDELGDDGEEVQDEEVAHREGAPEPAEALEDEPGVAHTGDGPEADDHLLVDDEDGDEQRQGPQQGEPVVLAGLGVGGHPAGVVVAHHDDEPGTDDGQQGEEPGRPRPPGRLVVLADGAEGAVDAAAVAAHGRPRTAHVGRPSVGRRSPARLGDVLSVGVRACWAMSGPPGGYRRRRRA